MSEEFDPFKLSSGLPLADADVTITSAEFRFDLEYNPDNVAAAITFDPDEEGVEEQEQLYSCGKNFEPMDDGASIAHESGKSVNFSQNSNYGRFIAAALECDGFREHAIESGYTPFEMALWEGTRWHLTGLEVEVRNPSKPNEPAKMRTVIIPDVFYGVGEEGEEEAPAKKAPAKKAAAKKAPAKKAAAKKAAPSASAATKKAISDLEDEDADMLAALVELAGEHAEHDDFMEAALEVEGVSDSRAAEKAVMDDKPGSIWADAQG